MSELGENGRDLELISKAGVWLDEALALAEASRQHALACFEEIKEQIPAMGFGNAMNGATSWEKYRQHMKLHGASLEDQNKAAELAIRHRRRAGKILADHKREPGRPTEQNNGDSVSPLSTPTYSELGLNNKSAQRLQDCARVPDPAFEEIVAKIVEAGDRELTAKEIEKIGRRMRQAEAKPEWMANEEFPGSAIVTRCQAIPFLQGFIPGTVDLLLTDPPYSTDVDDIEAFARSWLTLGLSRVRSSGRAYVFIGAYPREVHAYLEAFYNPGPELVSHHMTLEMILPWVYRNTLGPATGESYKLNWQACLYFAGPNVAPLNTESLTEKFSVQDFNAPDGRHGIRLHPWEKPAEIAERFIRHATMPGDVVVDPFAGTGTFLAAAARLGRNASGCEIDVDMIQFCKQRGIADESELSRAV